MAKLNKARERGSTLLEVLTAGAVVTVALVGLLTLMTTAIATNGRNRMETQATAVAQLVMQEIQSQKANSSSTINIYDQAGNMHTVSVAAGGSTDFSTSPVSGYSMIYALCKTLPCTSSEAWKLSSYDVRWQIDALGPRTSVVNMAVRHVAPDQVQGGREFALPVRVRAIAGPWSTPWQ